MGNPVANHESRRWLIVNKDTFNRVPLLEEIPNGEFGGCRLLKGLLQGFYQVVGKRSNVGSMAHG